ncbi:MAG: IclR family transcriptional regulator [Acidimicrobiia bacterium]|nr:IclR family transcriptional regulator [Acidimicrobiia bacterium]
MRNDSTPGDRASPPGEVGVLNKALDLIEVLASSDQLTVAELSSAAGVNKAAAYRILNTFERRGYALRTSDEIRRYSLGPAMRTLARDTVSPRDLLMTARPMLQSLWERYGETVNLGVMSNDRILYLDILESDQGLRTSVNVGALDRLHSTALGKAMLAALPVARAKEILSRTDMVAKTSRTITSLEEMLEELEHVRERGYALDDEENEPGARCVAAAIIDPHDGPIGALSVSGPSWRLPDEAVQTIGFHLVALSSEVAEQVS